MTGTRNGTRWMPPAGGQEGARGRALSRAGNLAGWIRKPWSRSPGTLGEVMCRGNVVMKGYLKNETATRQAFAGGWFHSGDLGVMDDEGYVALKDRSKDIVISGGENISSIEVENVLTKHPAVCSSRRWPSRTRNGARGLRLVEKRRGHDHVTEENISLRARIWPSSRRTGMWCSWNCPRLRPGKCRRFRFREMGRGLAPLSYSARRTMRKTITESRSLMKRARSQTLRFVFYSKFLFFEGTTQVFVPIRIGKFSSDDFFKLFVLMSQCSICPSGAMLSLHRLGLKIKPPSSSLCTSKEGKNCFTGGDPHVRNGHAEGGTEKIRQD